MPSIPKARHSFFALSSPPKKKERWSKGPNAAVYDSPRWRALRLQVLENQPFCKFCQEDKVIGNSEVVDHVIPIEFGGSIWDLPNLQGICTRHHNTKSSYEGKCNSLTDLKTYVTSKRGVGVKNFWGF